jgi:hypothetical protein
MFNIQITLITPLSENPTKPPQKTNVFLGCKILHDYKI